MTDGPATATANVAATLIPTMTSPAVPARTAGAGRAVDVRYLIMAARPCRPRSAPGGERPGDVSELVRPVQLGAQAGPGGPVRQVHLDLGDTESLAHQVDGERGLHAPAACQRARGLERRPGQAALPVQRLDRLPADGPADAGPGQPDHQAVPAELDGRGKDGNGHVGPAVEHGSG